MNNFNTLDLNLNNAHNLIPREQSYRISKKFLTVHAVDRDTKFYPLSNEFTIKCPQTYINVRSIKLSEISFPECIYNFSEKLNNNKFFIKVDDQTPITQIVIPSGYYRSIELTNILNRKLTSHDISVNYNNNQHTFTFIHLTNSFNLYNSDYNNNYNYDCSNNNLIYKYKAPLNTKSLETYPLNLGFLYAIGIDTNNESYIESSIDSDNSNKINSNICRFLDTQPIYMEIDKLNLYDEINPYPKGSNNLYNNYSNSSTDTAFIKLQPNRTIYNSTSSSSNLVTENNYNIPANNNVFSFFDPPLSRLQNLKFKFRYHDGRLVDIQDQDINFTLEIDQLRDKIPKQINIT